MLETDYLVSIYNVEKLDEVKVFAEYNNLEK